jgi:hypothetical protein
LKFMKVILELTLCFLGISTYSNISINFLKISNDSSLKSW